MALSPAVSSAKKQNIPVENRAYAAPRASLHGESELFHHAAAQLTYTVSELGATVGTFTGMISQGHNPNQAP